MDDFRKTQEKFIESIARLRKEHDNRVLWMERALDRDVQLLSDSKSIKSLDKRILLIEEDLVKIMNEYTKYTVDMSNLITSHVTEWNTQNDATEKEFLEMLALVKLTETTSNPLHSFVESDTVYLRVDTADDCFECVTSFKDTCARVTITAFNRLRSCYLKTVKNNAETALSKVKAEAQLRRDVHGDRLQQIKNENYAHRKAEIESFRQQIDLFWDEVTCGEKKYTKLFGELCQDTEKIVEDFKLEMKNLGQSVSSIDSSAELMSIAPQIAAKQETTKESLDKVIGEFQANILHHKTYIRDEHIKLMNYADQNNLKFSNNLKIKNEFDEFSELAEDMVVRAGKEHSKKETVVEHGGISLSHYKRTLFCVFYLERRHEILKQVKMKIKSEAVGSKKEMALFEKAVERFLSDKPIEDRAQLLEQVNDYTKLYVQAKALLNMFN
eukprot:sb/3464759/